MGTDRLAKLCRARGIGALYLFGSRSDDGLRRLQGQDVSGSGSDLDVGVLFREPGRDPRDLTRILVDLEDVFAPLRVDLVPLQHVDALFQYEAIDGHRVAAPDPRWADEAELVIMRRAAELLPIERELQRAAFGRSTV